MREGCMNQRVDKRGSSIELISIAMALLVLGGTAAPQDKPPEEASLRDKFGREIKDKDAAKRVEAIGRLAGAREEKTMALLVACLRDAAPEVRTSAAECIAGCFDGGGLAIAPLCALLLNKKEDVAVRLACARALGKAHYRAEAIDALIQAISSIDEKEKNLYKFGADCTAVLNEAAGQNFGAAKETPDRWKKWWQTDKARIQQEDQERRAAYKKNKTKGG